MFRACLLFSVLLMTGGATAPKTTPNPIDQISHTYWVQTQQMRAACEGVFGQFVIAWIDEKPVRACTFEDGTVVPEK